MGNREYIDGPDGHRVTARAWIEAAQKMGTLNLALPPIAVLYTLARACDPVPLSSLKAGGQHTDAQIV